MTGESRVLVPLAVRESAGASSHPQVPPVPRLERQRPDDHQLLHRRPARGRRHCRVRGRDRGNLPDAVRAPGGHRPALWLDLRPRQGLQPLLPGRGAGGGRHHHARAAAARALAEPQALREGHHQPPCEPERAVQPQPARRRLRGLPLHSRCAVGNGRADPTRPCASRSSSAR